MGDLYRELAQVCWDGGTLDGSQLQDMLVKHGVLVETAVEKPCSEWCNCRHNDAVFPTICYRLAAPQPPASRSQEAMREALVEARALVQEHRNNTHSPAYKQRTQDILDKIDAALAHDGGRGMDAQPAESGATEPKPGTHGMNSNYGDCG